MTSRAVFIRDDAGEPARYRVTLGGVDIGAVQAVAMGRGTRGGQLPPQWRPILPSGAALDLCSTRRLAGWKLAQVERDRQSKAGSSDYA